LDGAAPPPDGIVRPNLSGLAVYKMTGSGNDFVMVDARTSSPQDWDPGDIRAVCARSTGLGADGLVFVGPGSGSDAIRMVYLISDGSRAALCGNAALCTTRLAGHLGLTNGRAMHLETDAGTYEARSAGEDGRAELHLAPVAAPAVVRPLHLQTGEERAALAIVGVPHLVVLVDDVDQVDVAQRGRALRLDRALGPDGANVNFVSPGAGPSEWRMRTYERGVEAETLACGTGAVAAGCALDHWGQAELPVTLWTRSGRQLGVNARRGTSGTYDDVWLVGEAQMVFRGVLI
jgi:diaminopimelate epimerase